MKAKPVITSSRNPIFRHCLSLRDNRKRKRAKQFLVDGPVEILRAVQAGFTVSCLLVPHGMEVETWLHNLLQSGQDFAVQPLAPELLQRLSYGQTGPHPLAVLEEPSLSLDPNMIDRNSIVLVLDKTEKPGNLGACLRSAVASGVGAVVLTDPICDPFNANVIRASRGALFQVSLAITKREKFLELAARIDLPIFAARVEANRLLWELPLSRGAALLFGNETHGLSEQWQSSTVSEFTIPMQSGVDSLNLSISAALTLFEAVRQRTCRD